MHTFTTVASLLLTSSMLAACAVGPDYERPELSAPATFMGTPAIAQRATASAVELESWWKGFGDPLLAEFVAQAVEANLDIAQAAARVTQSKASLRAATAALLPSGTISAQATALHGSKQSGLGSLLDKAGADRDAEIYEGALGANWEIDIFGGLGRGREAAVAEYQAASADVAATRLAVAAQTADTYVTVRGLQTRIAIAKEQVETQRRLVSTVRLQFEKGIAPELQLLQAQGALSQVEAGVPVLEAGLEAAMNALDVLLGAQPGTNRARLEPPAPIPAAPAIADAGGPAELIRRRPDLIVAERRLAASNARIGVAISEYFPKFSLGGLLGTATTVAGNVLTDGANQAQGILGLRWRLFDFGRVDAEIAAAKGANAEVLAAYRLAVLRASQDVEDAFSALVKREAQAQSLATGERSLARAREASFAAYRGGVVSLIEVLDADTRLLATRDAHAQARTEAARAAIASFRALGGGWKPEPKLAERRP